MSSSFATPQTMACQAPLSMGFPRDEYWSGLPFLSPGYVPDPGIEHKSPALQADSSMLSYRGSHPQSSATPNLLSVSIDLPILDLSYKCNHTVDGLL